MLEALTIGTVGTCRGILVDTVDGVRCRGAHLVTKRRSRALSTLIPWEASTIWGATIGSEGYGGRWWVDLSDRGNDYLGACLNVLFS